MAGPLLRVRVHEHVPMISRPGVTYILHLGDLPQNLSGREQPPLLGKSVEELPQWPERTSGEVAEVDQRA